VRAARGALCLSVVFAAPLLAQRAPQSPFRALAAPVAAELSGERARSTVAFVEQYFRLPGNIGFDASIDTVAALLRAAGFVEERTARATDRLVYRVESRPMPTKAWSPLDASLTLGGRAAPLLTFARNKNMIAINSHPTPAAGVTARVIDIGAGADSTLDRAQLTGAIALVDGNVRVVYPKVLQRGGLGVLAVQRLPAYLKAETNVESIQFTGIAYDSVRAGFVIFLSSAARDSVRAALAAGPLTVRAVVNTRFDVRPEQTVVAELRGRTHPAERFVYSAHVQEPGANDNASGVGLLAEIARTTAVLFRAKRIDPARTLTFLWGDEIRSTQRFLAEDSVRRRGVKWGMSLDMVGEDTEKTGGTFLIEKMPDPSAVWVRGEDQHSEWGGRPIPVTDIRDHYFNDFVRQRCLDRARTTGWVVKANPFEGGSDHTPFLNARIPAVLLWHFTDQFYHTDRDRIDMVSAQTLANVGNCALTTGLVLVAGTDALATAMVQELATVAERELATQAALSRAASPSDSLQRTILSTWRDYFLGALEQLIEVPTSGVLNAPARRAAEVRIRRAGEQALSSLRR
jgi:hypothetical protein